jgi:thiol-disulfide isomerase/thioredoxin
MIAAMRIGGLAIGLALITGVAPKAQHTALAGLLGPAGLRDLEGRTWTAEALAGRVVVVDVWATWCAPCLAELPTLRRIAARDPEVAVIGVSMDSMSRREFVAWLSRHAVSWPQVFDGRAWSGPLPAELGLFSVPVSWVFDRRGHLVARDLRGQALVGAIDRLTRGHMAAPPSLVSR